MAKLMRLRSYAIHTDGTVRVETEVQAGADPEALPQAGDVVQIGIEIPAVPGLRGTYVVTNIDVHVTTMQVLAATFTLGPAQASNQTLVDEARLRAIVQRDHGAHPDWAAIWDELDFLPGNRRPEAMAQIQMWHRDQLVEAERRARIEAQAQAIAAAQAAEADAARQREAQDVQRQVRQILHDKVAAQYRPKPRKIDLGEDP